MHHRSFLPMQRAPATLLFLLLAIVVPLGLLAAHLHEAQENPDERLAEVIGPASDETSATPLPSRIETHWFAAASEEIATMEYHTSVSGQGLKAPNRAHNLRTYFRGADVEVVFIPRRRAEGN